MNDSSHIGSLPVDKQMHGKFGRGSAAESNRGARRGDLDEIALSNLPFVQRGGRNEDISVGKARADVAIGRSHISPLIQTVTGKNDVRCDFMTAKHDAVMIRKNVTMFNRCGVRPSSLQFLV